MKALRLFSTIIALALLCVLAVAAGAQEQAPSSNGGCTSTAGYDPACDVDHNGIIDVNDIQLTAGHWGATGEWAIEPHNHLGEFWVGDNNPLRLQGHFDSPDFAPLILSNTAPNGDGLRVESAETTGLYVGSAGFSGMTVWSSDQFGLRVDSAGSEGLSVGSAGEDGVYVGSAGQDIDGDGILDTGDGVHVESAGESGLNVVSAYNGVYVESARNDGLNVDSATDNGVYVDRASDDGVYVRLAGSPSAAYTRPSEHNGFQISGAQSNGLYVGRADADGMVVSSAGDDGVVVELAGNPSLHTPSPESNGFEVAGAEYHGLYVGWANNDGVYVEGTSDDGVHVYSADGDGVQVTWADDDGLYVAEADTGMNVLSAREDGVHVTYAGLPSEGNSSSSNNGFEVEGAQGHGLYVGRADINGIEIKETGAHGIYVGRPTSDGVKVDYAGANGVYANTDLNSHEWGFITPDKISASNVTLSSVSIVAQVTGEQALTPGDLVVAVAVTDPLPDSTVSLALVQLARSGGGVVGVVEGRMVLTAKPQQEYEQVQEPMPELRSAQGPAQPGDYVALTVLGVARVKVDADSDVQPGQRLTASNVTGHARALNTVEVDGVRLAEGASTIGIALAAPEPGQETIPVFVTLR